MMLDLFHRTGSAIPLWLVVFCGLLLSGCGSSEPDYPSTSLQGTVSVDGVPISEGKITFAPTTNGQGKGISGPIKDGRYQLENVPLGNVLVILSAERATGRMKMSSYGGEVPEIESLIPQPLHRGDSSKNHKRTCRTQL